MKDKIIKALATGFYLGKMPFMPGTFGTLLGIPVAWLFIQSGQFTYMYLTLALIFFASWVSELYERQLDSHDPGEIVIDEIVGYAVTMTWLPMTWQSFVASFLVFRFFDILKPFPINKIDQRIKGGLGTVLDDVAAGLVANIILQIVFAHTNWLGVQLHVGT